MKLTTAALICMILLLYGAACSQAEPTSSSAPQSGSVAPPSGSVATEPAPPPETSESYTTVVSDDDPVIGSEITISQEQQQQLIADVSDAMKNGIWVLMSCWYGLNFDETAEPVIRHYEQREYPYYPVTQFSTKEELLTYLLTYFSQDCINNLITPIMDTGDASTKYPYTVEPVLIEENGRLYTTPYPSGGGRIGYFADTIKIIEADEAGGYITATELPNGEIVDGKLPEGERIYTVYMRVAYERGRWVLDSFSHLNYWVDDPFAAKHTEKIYSDDSPYIVRID